MSNEIKCPYCEGFISSTAKKCKHCGEWIKPEKEHDDKKVIVESKPSEGCFLQTMNLGCGIVWVIIAIIVLCYIFSGGC